MDYQQVYEQWLASDELTSEDKRRLASLSEDEKKEMFYCPLQFGTAGMRGVLDPGTNRMNVFTVKRATQGLADYIGASRAYVLFCNTSLKRDCRRYDHRIAQPQDLQRIQSVWRRRSADVARIDG